MEFVITHRTKFRTADASVSVRGWRMIVDADQGSLEAQVTLVSSRSFQTEAVNLHMIAGTPQKVPLTKVIELMTVGEWIKK